MFDCIVVGAGIEGSSSAYHLVKKKCNTLLLEQFCLPHSRGSSHGASRIIRYAHDDPLQTELMKESFRMWHQLEKEANVTIYKQTGMLVVDKFKKPKPVPGDVNWDDVYATGIPHEKLSSRQFCQRYPGVRYDANYKGTLEIPAGTLKADKALRCYQDLFVKHGGTLQECEQVLEIIPGTVVTVKTNKGTYTARHLVLTPGPWASGLMLKLGLKLPLRVERISVCYWKEKVPGTFANFPIFVDFTFHGDNAKGVYALPIDEYPGLLKLCLHQSDHQVINDPNERDSGHENDDSDVQVLSHFVRTHFPALEDKPAIVETCLYTSTPDDLPVIDKHPTYPNIAFACGMSGAGFKFAPVYGKIMAQFVTGDKLDYDLSAFRHDRFKQRHNSVKSKL